jgi:hypothetical protein
MCWESLSVGQIAQPLGTVRLFSFAIFSRVSSELTPFYVLSLVIQYVEIPD